MKIYSTIKTARIFFSLLVLLSFAAEPSIAAPISSMVPANLSCELRKEPVGVDVINPDFSYTLHALNKTARGLSQQAYQLLVSNSTELLLKNEGNFWNSGKVSSDKMAYLTYAGKPLQSGSKYYWKVRVWDQNGVASGWSKVATFTMGILKDSDWKAKWLTAKDAEKFARTL
ncbi:MAG TPA: hypothetical protein VF610_12835, partial [Segetibacter sp.]